jgi:hypothetical protein
MRATAAAETEAIRRQADEERQTLDAQSAAKRTQVEEDFDIAMSARRAEAMTTIHHNQVSSRDEANALLANARAEVERKVSEAQHAADTMINAAEQRVAALDALRAEMASRLSDLRGVLDRTLPSLAPVSEQSVVPSSPPAAGTPRTSNGGVPTQSGEHGAAVPNGAAFSHNGVTRPHPIAAAPATGPFATNNGTESLGSEPAASQGAQRTGSTEPGPSRSGDSQSGEGQPGDGQSGDSESGDAGAPRDAPRSATSEQGTSGDPTPTPRSSPEVRPSPRGRRPTPAGHQR